MPTHLFNAFFESVDGVQLGGPVTVEKGEYLFVNKNSADDVYFNLSKSPRGWYQSGETSTQAIPQQYIHAVGAQIDAYHNSAPQPPEGEA
jgi:hypothetical protein